MIAIKCSLCEKIGDHYSSACVTYLSCGDTGHSMGDKKCLLNNVECFHCNQKGHHRQRCLLSKCERCSRLGHFEMDCPICPFCGKDERGCNRTDCPDWICPTCRKQGHFASQCPMAVAARQTYSNTVQLGRKRG